MDALPSRRDLQASYEAENREPCVRGARTVAWIVLLVLPPFYLVDASRFPARLDPLTWLRLVSAVGPLVVLLLLATERGRRHPRALTVLFSAIGAVITTAQMSWTGEHASPYFAGLGLGMLLPALIMPWVPGWTWLNCAVIVVSYLVTAQALGFEPRGDAIANNLFSYLATALIAGFATVSRERLRWREFLARRALEESRERLREEAGASRALAQAGREMIGLLDAPLVLDRLCELTTHALACDQSHTIMRDRSSDIWRVVAQHGDTSAQWRILRRIEASTRDVAALLEALSRDGIVQANMRSLASPGSPFETAARTGITTVLLVPLYSGAEMIGIQTAGYRGRDATFGESQRKVALGLAQLASMTLANARLHEELAGKSAAERAARTVAESASRAKDEFLATLSHELRTPLNVILGYLEVLDDRGVAPGERDRVLGRIRAASRQLLYMITDTLEISRLHAGQASPQIEHVRLADFWHDLRAQCAELPRTAGVALFWGDAVPGIWMPTDQRMLLVILRNLVSNGLKFTESGSVTVGVAVDRGHVAFSVTDTGIGIAPEARERIFEMFQQVDASDRRRFGGVGLGLYIVNRFCAKIGASIGLESEPGRGSRFTVRLPCGATEHAAQAMEESPTAGI